MPDDPSFNTTVTKQSNQDKLVSDFFSTLTSCLHDGLKIFLLKENLICRQAVYKITRKVLHGSAEKSNSMADIA